MLCALAVVIGVGLEFVLAGWFEGPPVTFLNHWGTAFADAIVAIGVAGEVLFGRRARLASEELTRRSEARLADATERAGKAEKTAAETHERAAKLEQLTGWRKFTQMQFDMLVTELRATGVPFRPIIEYERGDPEAYSFVYQLAQVLTKAGSESFQSGPNSYLAAGIFGVLFAAAPEIEAKPILDAFDTAGLPLWPTNWDFSRSSRPDGAKPNVYFFVAPKPPPIFIFSGEALNANDETDSMIM